MKKMTYFRSYGCCNLCQHTILLNRSSPWHEKPSEVSHHPSFQQSWTSLPSLYLLATWYSIHYGSDHSCGTGNTGYLTCRSVEHDLCLFLENLRSDNLHAAAAFLYLDYLNLLFLYLDLYLGLFLLSLRIQHR